MQNYLKNGLKRHSDIVEVPKAPKGLEFRTLGTQESPIFSKLKVRLKSGRKAFSIRGANALAKVCILADKTNIEDIETPISIDTSVEDWIKMLEDTAKRNMKSCKAETVGSGDFGVTQSHSEYRFMKELFEVKGLCGSSF